MDLTKPLGTQLSAKFLTLFQRVADAYLLILNDAYNNQFKPNSPHKPEKVDITAWLPTKWTKGLGNYGSFLYQYVDIEGEAAVKNIVAHIMVFCWTIAICEELWEVGEEGFVPAWGLAELDRVLRRIETGDTTGQDYKLYIWGEEAVEDQEGSVVA